ncbi:MAG: electron transfer flavoprotein subunit alpha/FixB family protein [Bacteroidia bacterium]|nr:electron transfer flavoprotein subunit alpha/FixB family protein [Bacteroidia bacterium]
MNTNIYVIAEHIAGCIPDIVHEMLAQASHLAGITGGTVTALLPGCEPEILASRLVGASRVQCIEGEALRNYSPESWLLTLAPILGESMPGLIMVSSSSMGLDLAAALSATLDIPLASACVDIRIENGVYHFTSQLYGGKLLLDTRCDSPSAIAQILPGSFKPLETDTGSNVHVEQIAHHELPRDLRMKFENYIEPTAGDVDITQSDVLISVGRGIQSQDNLSIAEDLAALLHGTVSASRPIIDQNWLPITRQVGKSGMTVTPKLYFALGISGAPEHLEGMKGASMIVAINKDTAAPIFSISHYGVAADLFDILPVLNERLRERGQ